MGLLGKRREKRTPRKVIRASGMRVDLTNRDAVRRLAIARQQWQTDAWGYRDMIGELRFALQFRARAVARLRFYAAEIVADEDDPIPMDSDGATLPASLREAAAAELARMPWDTGYQFAGIACENMDVAGECWLHGWDDDGDEDEHWEVLSTSEVIVGQDGSLSIRRYGEGMVTSVPDGHEMIRLWVPHPQYKELADSPMKALLDTCEELVLAGREIRAASRSRIARNGILAISAGFSMNIESVEDDDAGDEVDTFERDLQAQATAPIADEGDPGSVFPSVIRGELEDVKDGIKHIKLDREVASDILDRIDKWLARLAKGLDIPPEVMSGLGDTNHWTAWQIDASTFRYHIDPSARILADSVTTGWLRPALRSYNQWSNADINRVVIWRDAGNLTENPNRGQDAINAFDRGGIGWKALRDALGFNDSHAPDDDELVKMIALKAGVTPDVAALLLQSALGTVAVPASTTAPIKATSERVDRPADQIGPGQTPPDAADAVPAGGTPGGSAPSPGGMSLLATLLASTVDTPKSVSGKTEVDTPAVADQADTDPEAGWTVNTARDLTDIDRQLRDRILIAADGALTRALDVAGARLRSKAQKHPSLRGELTGVNPRDIGEHLANSGLISGGWGGVLDVFGITEDELLSGALDRLSEQFHVWVDSAIDAAITATLRLLKLDPDSEAAESLSTRLREVLAARVSGAWNWLRDGLHRLAQRHLSNPQPDEEPGEVPDLLVPPGLVRAALAQIGGPRTGSGGVDDDGTPVQHGRPVGGIATGQNIADVLDDAGSVELGYEWAYGITPRGRQFKPHQRLDGVRFTDFTDEILSTLADGNTWLGAHYHPGDHNGCMCDYVLIYAIPDRSAILAQNLNGPGVQDEDTLAAMDDAAGRTGTTAQEGRAERQRIQLLQERYITQGRQA